jgi:cytochrome P450
MQPYIDRLKVLRGLARATARKLTSAAELAPGELDVDPTVLEDDQFLLLKKSRALGPIFKVWWNGKLTTCVMGIQGGMRFLAAHGKYLRAATIDMRPIFPFGFLREMEGSTHAQYRKLFHAAFRTTAVEAMEDPLSEVIRRRLCALAAGGEKVARNDLAKALMALTTEVMFRAVFGLGRDTARYDALVALYEDYAPDGMPLTLRSRHRQLYAQIRAQVLAHADDANAVLPNCLLSALLKARPLDDTIVGNLVHIVQFARYDMEGLWHWILLDASGQAEYLEQIRLRAEGRRELSTAFVSETLRMQQSEYIYRRVTKTFEDDGVLFLKGTRARVCVWESHRDPQHFPEPDVFEPKRFLEARIPKGAYSPFGLDHHRCLGADWATQMSALFLEGVADELVLARGSYGTPHRGRFHFEPGLDSDISLSVRARQ